VSPPQADRTVNIFSELHDRLSGPETPIGAGYKTLEQMTVEVMRPMLKDWLDTHLPSMVERLVQEEIERMVHRATQPRR
jgi:cell pole-organizing protein PopZ